VYDKELPKEQDLGLQHKDDKYIASVHNYGSSIGKFTLLEMESRLTYKAATQTVTLYINRKVLQDVLDKYPNDNELVLKRAQEEFDEMVREKNVVKSLIRVGKYG